MQPPASVKAAQQPLALLQVDGEHARDAFGDEAGILGGAGQLEAPERRGPIRTGALARDALDG